jgi:hypothetical protein
MELAYQPPRLTVAPSIAACAKRAASEYPGETGVNIVLWRNWRAKVKAATTRDFALRLRCRSLDLNGRTVRVADAARLSIADPPLRYPIAGLAAWLRTLMDA